MEEQNDFFGSNLDNSDRLIGDICEFDEKKSSY